MTAQIIDGKKIAEDIHHEIKEKLSNLDKKPGLAVILVGNNPASELYVNMKEKDAKNMGFNFRKITLPEDISQIDLIKEVDNLNQDNEVHGFIVQLPLPDHINTQLIIDSILPHKDVDGFTAINMGNIVIGNNILIPATPKGIIRLIESTGVDLKGKHAVVVGRSNIVGKPVSMLLQQKNCTVTMCHSKSKPLEKFTKQADILVAAVGVPNLISKDMVKEGAIVIDVGTNSVDGKLVGDVSFDEVKEVAGFITPVPGGVGPMTRACLLENVIEAIGLNR